MLVVVVGVLTVAVSAGGSAAWASVPQPNLNDEVVFENSDYPPGLSGGHCGQRTWTFNFWLDSNKAYGMFSYRQAAIAGNLRIVDGAIVSLRITFTLFDGFENPDQTVRGVMTAIDPRKVSFSCQAAEGSLYWGEIGVSSALRYTARIPTSYGQRYDSGTARFSFDDFDGTHQFWTLRFASEKRGPAVIDHRDFTSTAGLSLNGSAEQRGNLLQLTNGGDEPVGSVWSQTPVSPGLSFQSRFTFSSATPYGFAFVLQRDPAGTAALGRGGRGLGYGGLTPSLAVAFDPATPNLISLYENGPNGELVNSFDVTWPFTSQAEAPIWIAYNAFRHTLSIWTDVDSWVFFAAGITIPVDLEAVMGGPAPVLVGFTAAAQPGDEDANTLQKWRLSAFAG